MRALRAATDVALALAAVTAWAQPAGRDPHIGYVYPAGGRQGSTFRVTVGGQYLQGARAAYVSGEGVRASVIEFVRPIRPNELATVGRHLRDLIAEKTRAQTGAAPPAPKPRTDGKEAEPEPLPDHPWLRDLEKKSLADLLGLLARIFDPKKQMNMQIAEQVEIEVTVDANAAPGDRELRLGTPAGLSNPLVFQVGVLPEALEREPNGPQTPLLPGQPAATLDLPVVLNGQITPGDVDRFRFRATQGQPLVIEVQARHLIPYLADAVPGWFQATVALYDAKRREVAFADDYRFDPDPVLFYAIPEAGEYEVEVRDAIYRGRDDFVYRVSVGELPFITRVFPLGGKVGEALSASVDGWNLPWKQLSLDTQPTGIVLRQMALRQDAPLCNRIAYAADDLPEREEKEPNDTPGQAQAIEVPCTVNGRIGQPGDVDLFRIRGRAGDEIVAEVLARRLGSPVDSLVRITGASGKVIAWNDDHEDPGMGLCTHHADSYATVRLPLDGLYRVQVTEAEGHGGDAYAYRLRVSSPRPDFALRVNPSSINVRAPGSAVVWAHALRKEGFAGDIAMALKGAPPGFVLDGARIPAGRDSVRMTLTAPQAQAGQPFAARLEGQGQIGGATVARSAVPCEDMMQAFAYRHLVPAQQLLVSVAGGGRLAPIIAWASKAPVRLPAGGTAEVRVNAPGRAFLPGLQLALSDPPKGVALDKVADLAGGFSLTLKAGPDAPAVGYADNLIVEASTEIEPRKPDGTPSGQKRRISLGPLPALPFEIVAR
jgi:hypothetical protein